MKNKKFVNVGLAVSLMLSLSGCTSLQARVFNNEFKKDILKTVEIDKTLSPLNKEDETTPITTMPLVESKKEVRFNLLVNKAPIGAILQSLVDGTSYSVVMPEELTGNISLNLKNVTAFDVLETLKNVYHYDYEVVDKRIIVYPNGIRTKVFVINHLVGKRNGSSELKVSSGSLTENQGGMTGNANSASGTQGSSIGVAHSQINSSKISTSVDSDFWKEIEQVVNMMLNDKNGRSVVVSQETNTMVVRGLPREINEVEKYLRKIQAIIDRQVVIEAKLIEVELKNGMQSGINWAAFKTNANTRSSVGFGQSNAALAPGGMIGGMESNPVTAVPGQDLVFGALNSANSMFSLAFQTSNFASILSFLEKQGNLQILSSPRIATLNNQKAVLKVGTDEFFITNVTTTSTSTSAGTTSTPSVTTQPFFSGIALDITPQIDDNGMVTMHVHPSVSQVSTVTKNINLGNLGSLVLPLASSTISETDSVVKIESNKIVAIGGLMKQYSRKEKNQVPGFGDAPIVGNAFKNVNNELVKYELVILIKPQIIHTQADWETSLKEARNRLADFDKTTDVVVNGELKNTPSK